MAVISTDDAQRVASLADGACAADPVAHTVFGSIATAAREADATPWAAHPEGRAGVLAARSRAHAPVSLTAGWDETGELADALASLDPAPVGLGGPPHTIGALVERLGLAATRRMDERLFRLDALHGPRGVPGSARTADEQDASWLAEWYVAFTIEAFGRIPPGFDASKMVERGVRGSLCWIWCDDTGAAVSYAVRHPAVCGVARIGPVYTPAQLRGHGYGSAATAAATRDILDDGDVPCLLTDLANPTSNHIYAQLGFRAVTDRSEVRFD